MLWPIGLVMVVDETNTNARWLNQCFCWVPVRYWHHKTHVRTRVIDAFAGLPQRYRPPAAPAIAIFKTVPALTASDAVDNGHQSCSGSRAIDGRSCLGSPQPALHEFRITIDGLRLGSPSSRRCACYAQYRDRYYPTVRQPTQSGPHLLDTRSRVSASSNARQITIVATIRDRRAGR
jgi:hypothetical protein